MDINLFGTGYLMADIIINHFLNLRTYLSHSQKDQKMHFSLESMIKWGISDPLNSEFRIHPFLTILLKKIEKIQPTSQPRVPGTAFSILLLLFQDFHLLLHSAIKEIHSRELNLSYELRM